jgi:succinate dehydrogenase / fumarate reductase membrane anchor subunit
MAEKANRFRTPLGRARGLGSAKEGVQHWWMQRVTAVALVPLTLWFVATLIGRLGADHAAAAAWLSEPVPLGLTILLVAAVFYHAQLGLQVVIEDYVHAEAAKIILVFLSKLASLLLGLSAVLALLFIAFHGS